MSSDEQPDIGDSALSEVLRRPTRAAGDLSEVGDDTAGHTMEDLARDLEPAVSKPTDREILEEILERVRRIEEHLDST